MNEEPVTIDEILKWCKEAVSSRRPISNGEWLDISQKLAVLVEDLDEDLIGAEMVYRRLESGFQENNGYTASKAKAKARASDEYGDYLLLKAKRDRVTETIRISKLRVGLQKFDS